MKILVLFSCLKKHFQPYLQPTRYKELSRDAFLRFQLYITGLFPEEMPLATASLFVPFSKQPISARRLPMTFHLTFIKKFYHFQLMPLYQALPLPYPVAQACAGLRLRMILAYIFVWHIF